MSQEETNLAAHVEICALRFKGIEEKMTNLEKRLNKVEDTLTDLKTQTQTGFTEIKVLLERQNSNRHTTMITVIGSIVVAVISVIGYLITRH
jgi:CII-binding regulator of phage lambda lysogenization HflD